MQFSFPLVLLPEKHLYIFRKIILSCYNFPILHTYHANLQVYIHYKIMKYINCKLPAVEKRNK